MVRAVVDTNVLIAALRSSRGASFRLLSLLGDPRWQPAVSVALVLEYDEVATREAARLGLDPWVPESVIDMFCQSGSQHAIHFRLRPTLQDPDDEFLIELAVAANAGFIVTHNVRDFRGAGRYGVQAVTPAGFLKTIGAYP